MKIDIETDTQQGCPLKDWNTIYIHLGTNPDAQTLLDTYGHTAWHTLEHDLARHPYLASRITFKQAYQHALWHRTLQAARTYGHLANTTYKALATITGIPAGRLRDWHQHIKQPHLERVLYIHETARQHWEHHLPTEAKHHIIDPSIVYTTFHPLLNHPKIHTPKPLATSIETLYHHKKDQRLLIAELKPYHKTGPQKLRIIAHAVSEHRSEIEHILTERLNLPKTHEELRIAVDHDILYLWRKTTHPDHWLNTYHHELLYLTPKVKETLIYKAQRHLNVNNQQLGQLIDQLTNHPRENLTKPRAIPYELYPAKYSKYLYGDTLHFLIDTINLPFKSIKSEITQIGRIANYKKGGGLCNPLFPEGHKLHDLRARLLAIGLSDCHITHNHVLSYHENNPVRISYVKKLFRKLGDCIYQVGSRKGQRKRLTLTTPVGRLLKYWGVPIGDKHLHSNYCLPETIRCSGNEVKCAYLAEVIPEDGFFVKRTGGYKFGIKRATLLVGGPKAEEYGFLPKISQQHIELIEKYGKKRSHTIRNDKQRTEITLTKGKLRKIAYDGINHEDRQIAQQLEKIIYGNPCRLLEDEISIVKSLGIEMTRIFKELKLQESGRVSAIWEAYTSTEADTYRWAEIALPASEPKRDAVLNWLFSSENR